MKIEKLLPVLDLDIEDYPKGTIKKVELDEKSRIIKVEIEFEKVPKSANILQLISKLENYTVFQEANKVFVYFSYADNYIDDVKSYYNLAYNITKKLKPQVEMLQRVNKKFSDSITFLSHKEDELSIKNSVKFIDNCLNVLLGLNIKTYVEVDNNTPSFRSILTENHSEVQRIAEAQKREYVPVETKSNSKFPRREAIIEGQEVISIGSIPTNKAGVDKLISKNKTKQVTVEGVVFDHNAGKTKKGNDMHKFSFFDNESSISCIRFSNKNQDESGVFFNNSSLRLIAELSFNEQFGNCSQLTIKKAIPIENPIKATTRTDEAKEKRVELNLHSNMSTLDGISDVSQLCALACTFGHSSIALTDIENVHNYPNFNYACKKHKLKPIYGLSAKLVDPDKLRINFTDNSRNIKDSEYVIFDIETTGFSVNFDQIIEIGAVKVRNGAIVEQFSRFVKPTIAVPAFITNLTTIQQSDVDSADPIEIVLKDFINFIDNAIVVAHNASFDMSHIYENMSRLKINKTFDVIDSLGLFRGLYYENTKVKQYGLKAMSKFFGVDLDTHHRAVDDCNATALCFIHMINELENRNILDYNMLNDLYKGQEYKFKRNGNITLLAKNRIGLKNIYKIVSESHTKTFFQGAKIYKDFLESHRDGLLVGSGNIDSDTFELALNKSYSELKSHMEIFDYIEIQPLNCYRHIIENYYEVEYNIEEELNKALKRIYDAAKELKIMVVATGDVYYTNSELKEYREIYIRTTRPGGGRHNLMREEILPDQHFLSTSEMLEKSQFPYLSEKEIKQIVVTNSNKIADQVETFDLFPRELFTPADNFLEDRGTPSMEQALIDIVNFNTNRIYGDNPHKLVKDRLDKEMHSIISNKFTGIYYISHLLVKNSLDNGYVVGSRGSVGSSFVATMSDITEVNPLPPHYVCSKCKFTTFKLNEEDKTKYPLNDNETALQEDLLKVGCGYDLPNRACPECGTNLTKNGHDIPFETFLGFDGTKVPDIDLNFSGAYQPKAHEFTRTMFGHEYAFRAGTISTVADKTAFGYIKGYYNDKGTELSNAEAGRRASNITGVKRTTGQHPGGIIVVPNNIEIYDITPVQFPSDDINSNWRTTHFDYHSFEHNLLKLDILGHDDPTILRQLMDYVEAYPDEFPFSTVEGIPLDDPKIYALFNSLDSLGIKKEEFTSEVGTLGLPEVATPYVRGMLEEIRPTAFSQLVKISGLSHGTDVWLGNAREFVNGTSEEFKGLKVEFDEIIGCRDDIMVYLMYQGLPPTQAFAIMEFVRKGKPSKEKDKWEEYKKLLAEYNVAPWYILSCEKIKYMFPKAHATAYVLKAIRMAWFKVYRSIYFYAAWLTSRAKQMDAHVMAQSINIIRKKMKEIENLGYKASKTDQDLYVVLEMSLEMNLRGISFKQIDITKSQATEFVVVKEENKLLLPLTALKGFGEVAARKLVASRDERPFTSREDLKARKLLNKTAEKGMVELDAMIMLPTTEPNKVI